jgi:hypothetical protein
VTPNTVWVRVEFFGEQWRLVAVYANSEQVTRAEPGWEAQGPTSFARLRDDGRSEWLEATSFEPLAAPHVPDQPPTPSSHVPDCPAPRNPWARPTDS